MSKEPPPQPAGKHPPAITLPPRIGIESLFTGGPGASPGPMTLVSSFFANDPDGDCSFSQLLAGGNSSSSDVKDNPPDLAEPRDGSGSFTFQQRGPAPQPPESIANPGGMTLTNFLDSSVFFDSSQAAFGTLQQRLAQTEAERKIQTSYPSSSSAAPPQDHKLSKELHDNPFSDQKQRPCNLIVDKPSDDGYNWRKYGQKQVKGGDFPRSYYKCTHPSCPVKKKVERSLDGQITEIIYRGQHNHTPPSKRTRDPGNANEVTGNSGKLNEEVSSYPSSIREQDHSQVTPERLSGSTDGEEVDGVETTRVNDRNEDEPESKRRIVETAQNAGQASHRTVTEPRIVVQTTSEVDLLDDGYRWRKYGQKVVKGNPNPRSYYKCSHPGCSIRKHVERAATDPKAVITTYEGKHNHDAPTSKSSNHGYSGASRQPGSRH